MIMNNHWKQATNSSTLIVFVLCFYRHLLNLIIQSFENYYASANWKFPFIYQATKQNKNTLEGGSENIYCQTDSLCVTAKGGRVVNLSNGGNFEQCSPIFNEFAAISVLISSCDGNKPIHIVWEMFQGRRRRTPRYALHDITKDN